MCESERGQTEKAEAELNSSSIAGFGTSLQTDACHSGRSRVRQGKEKEIRSGKEKVFAYQPSGKKQSMLFQRVGQFFSL